MYNIIFWNRLHIYSIIYLYFMQWKCNEAIDANDIFPNKQRICIPMRTEMKEIQDQLTTSVMVLDHRVYVKFKDKIVASYAKELPVIHINGENMFHCEISDHCSKVLRIIGIYTKAHDLDLNFWKYNLFQETWNQRSEVIIWLLSRTTMEEVTGLLQYFWQYEYMNVIVFIPDEEGSCHFKCFTFNPFMMDEHGVRGLTYEITDGNDFFPRKWLNMYGYNISISSYHRPPFNILENYEKLAGGTEVHNLKTMSATYNFTIQLVTSNEDGNNHVVELENGEEVGLIGDVLTNRSMFVSNVVYADAAFGRKVEIVNPFFLSYFVAIVPINKGNFGIERYLSSFFILTVGAIGCLIIYLHLQKQRYPILTSLQLLLFQRFDKFDNNNYFHKYFLLLWVLWATVVSSLYQADIYRYFSTPSSITNINTLEELHKSGIQVQVPEDVLEILQNSEDIHHRRLSEHAIAETKLIDCFEEFKLLSSVSCGVDYFQGMEYFKDLIESENPTAHIVREPLGEFWYTLPVRYGYPYLEQLEYSVRHFMANGLFVKWIADDQSNYTHAPRKVMKKFSPLTISYFQSVYIVNLGWFIAAFAFLVELLSKHAKK